MAAVQPPIENFQQVLNKLTQFNASQGNIQDIEGPIGRLNEVVGRLATVNTDLKQMLQKIVAELGKMKASNFEGSKKRISDITSTMSKSLNEIEKLLPINRGGPAVAQPPASPEAPPQLRGGFQYSKSKSRSRSKAKSHYRTRRRRSHNRRHRR